MKIIFMRIEISFSFLSDAPNVLFKWTHGDLEHFKSWWKRSYGNKLHVCVSSNETGQKIWIHWTSFFSWILVSRFDAIFSTPYIELFLNTILVETPMLLLILFLWSQSRGEDIIYHQAKTFSSIHTW